MNRAETRASAAVFAGYFLFCLALQWATRAWSVSFLAYPDEPSHFVGAVMVRDWLWSGRWFAPVQFATEYYRHYPFFAVGYWPPLFYCLTAGVFLIGGVGRVQALLLPAACAAGVAWLIFRMLKERVGPVAAVCAGLLYLSLPVSQRWICAVMVDHMTAFLCIAAAVCLVRYLGRPDWRSGALLAIVCGCAVLAKYSALYLVALPWAAVVLFRRAEVLRRPSFWLQPAMVAVLVGPWFLVARGWAFAGLPKEQPALTAARAGTFVMETFRTFPAGPAIVVLGGLLALAALPRAWKQLDGILILLSIGHLSLLILSPVQPERRYLLAPAAALLVLSFAGWGALLERCGARHGRFAPVVPVLVAVLTLGFAGTAFGRYSHASRYPVRQIAARVLQAEGRSDRRILLASRFEGAFVAEFAAHDSRRPGVQVVRATKELCRENWFGQEYASLFSAPEQVTEYLRERGIQLIVVQEIPKPEQRLHERLLAEAIARDPLEWRKAASFPPDFACSIYERAPRQ